MRSAMLHFAKYMASYAILMGAAYILWLASGSPAHDAVLQAGTFERGAFMLSNFLIGFSIIAYPLYALIAACIRRIPRAPLQRRSKKENSAGMKKRAMTN